MTTKRVFVALPHTGWLHAELCMWLIAAREHYGEQIAIAESLAKPVEYNRNILVDRFLKTDCTHLLFIDSDTIPCTDIIRMVDNDKMICGAPYQAVRNGEVYILAMDKNKHGSGYIPVPIEVGKLTKVDVMGTGAMMIDRRVFEKMEKPYFQYVFDAEGKVVRGEDYDFCFKASKFTSAWIDGSHHCAHYVETPVLPVPARMEGGKTYWR